MVGAVMMVVKVAMIVAERETVFTRLTFVFTLILILVLHLFWSLCLHFYLMVAFMVALVLSHGHLRGYPRSFRYWPRVIFILLNDHPRGQFLSFSTIAFYSVEIHFSWLRSVSLSLNGCIHLFFWIWSVFLSLDSES